MVLEGGTDIRGGGRENSPLGFNNPLHTKFSASDPTNRYQRKSLSEQFSYAILTYEHIERICDYSPIVEIGAGNGYTAHLIEQADGDIEPFDIEPENDNDWTEVLEGDEEAINKHPEHTLMLVYPPNDDEMASNCLENYDGDKLIFVGNEEITAEDRFFDRLEDNWEIEESHELPHWESYEDELRIYSRIT